LIDFVDDAFLFFEGGGEKMASRQNNLS
jgi:hypothetical protein